MIKRFVLSIYHYEKKHEEKRFFDAWWQFSYTLEYIFLGIIFSLTNIIIGLNNMEFHMAYYVVPIAFLFIFNLIFSKSIQKKYENRVINETKLIKPYPIWVLYFGAFIGIILFLLSFSFFEN